MSVVEIIKKNFNSWKWLALGFGITAVILYSAIISHKNFKTTIVTNFYSQQKVLVSTFQDLLVDYITEARQNLTHISKDIIRDGINYRGLEHISTTYEIHKDDFYSIGLLDEEGDYLFISPQSAGEDSVGSTFVKKTIQSNKNMIEPFLSEKHSTGQDQSVAYLFVPFTLPGEKKYFVAGVLMLETFINSHLTTLDGSDLCFILADDYGDIYSLFNTKCKDPEMMKRGNMFTLDNACLSCHGQNDFDDIRQAVDENRIINSVYKYPTIETMNRTTIPFQLYGGSWTISICGSFELMQGAINKNARNNLIYLLLSILVIGLLVYTSHRTKRRQVILEAEADNLRINAKSAEALRDSEEKFRNFVEASADLVIRLSKTGYINYVSPKVRDIYGYQPGELIGKHLRITTPIGEVPRAIKALKLVFTGKPLKNFEINQRAKDGQIIPMEINAIPIYQNGKIVEFQGIMRDITVGKKAEAALRESENSLKEAQRIAELGSWSWDIKTNDMAWSENLCLMHGIKPTEFDGQFDTALSFIHPDDLVFVQKKFQQLLNEKKPSEFEYRIVTRNGHVKFVWGDQNMTFDEEGNVIRMIGILQDITKDKQAEEKLKESEAKWRSMTENSPDQIIVLDKESNIQFINYSVSEIPVQKVIGTHISNYFPNKSWPDIEKCFERVWKTGKPDRYEMEYESKDSSFNIYFEGRVSPIIKDDEIVSLIINASDITERKKTEEQLRHAQKLESITRLTGGIAHDFNNILGSIFGGVDMILMQLPKGHPSRRFADIILDKSQKAADLVNQMMAYSRQQQLNVMPMVINNAIEDLSLLLDRALEERIKLKLVLADDLKPINGDKTAIDQIVMNLCLNATDAMKEGGKLTVRTENLENVDKYIEEHLKIESGEYVLLSIADTGHGIEADNLDQIFDPFFTTKEIGEGTGLGLSMVFGLVKQHEGYIFCQSKVGKGTTFEVLFPVIDKLQAPTEKESINGHLHHGGGTIMVVEDEKDLIEIIEAMLTELGYDIITASDGKKALQIYRGAGKPIDLVISDIIMPKMGGKELYQELVKINPDVKFVFISGYASRGFYKKFDVDPNMKILNKPFRLKEVSDMVKGVLNLE